MSMSMNEQARWARVLERVREIPGAELLAGQMRQAIHRADMKGLCKVLILGDRYPTPINLQIREAFGAD